MKRIIGQDRLLKEIDSYTLDTFPQSSVLIGDTGSGKDLIVEYISDKFNLNKVGINEVFDNIYNLPEPTIVSIDIDDTSINEKNKLLKLVEEPPKGVILILMVSDTDNMIDTLYSRCHEFKLDRYDPEVLRDFIVDDDTGFSLEIGRTPGDIIKLNNLNLNNLVSLCYKILNGIDLLEAIDIMDEISEYDIRIFFRAMLAIEFKESNLRNPDVTTEYMKLTAQSLKLSKNKTLDRDKLISSYLTSIVGANFEHQRS